MTDNNALNYRSEHSDRLDTSEKSSIGEKKITNRTDVERESGGNGSGGGEPERERRVEDHITIQDLKDLKDLDRDSTSTHTDHSSNKKRRQNSSNCDNSLISTYNTNIQERHYSQDSQVRIFVATLIISKNLSDYFIYWNGCVYQLYLLLCKLEMELDGCGVFHLW